MSKSARSIIKEEMEVEVKNFAQIDENLGVLSFFRHIAEEGPTQRYDDVYNVKDADVMKTLLQDRAGKRVFATVAPDSSADTDSHPEIINARILAE